MGGMIVYARHSGDLQTFHLFLGGMCCNTCGTLGESEISGESIPDLDDLGKMR